MEEIVIRFAVAGVGGRGAGRRGAQEGDGEEPHEPSDLAALGLSTSVETPV